MAGAIGIPAILGVISAPVGLVLEGIAMGSVGFMVILKYTMKRLTAKMKKHEKIKLIADTKLNTIMEYVSQAINDGSISQEEFLLITCELAKFNALKEDIRNRTREKLVKIDSEKNVEEEVEKRVSERIKKEKISLIEKLSSSS